ncbi:MAG TPA: VOC family protein [Rhizomicrobium sp.]|nr:VOC family protein [Rhizomicrobium sp.]
MPNNFFWYDLVTTDVAAARKFYSEVVGWSYQDVQQGDNAYGLFKVGDAGVAGLMPFPKGMEGGHPGWNGYIAVEDVDAMAARIAAEGGKIWRGPMEVPGVIRFAVVADPQGAAFIIAKGLEAQPVPRLPTGAPGTIGWRELFAADWEKDFAFYQKLFGWTKAEAHNMGAMGIYQLFAAGDAPIGGMMNKPAVMPQSWWNYYINVDAIDAAKARVEKAGGSIKMGPAEVPGGQWILQGQDPQGAFFALVALKR